jgi:hypothetical protein
MSDLAAKARVPCRGGVLPIESEELGLRCEYHLAHNTAKAQEEGACLNQQGPLCRQEEQTSFIGCSVEPRE